jgi:hypothetical protein
MSDKGANFLISTVIKLVQEGYILYLVLTSTWYQLESSTRMIQLDLLIHHGMYLLTTFFSPSFW